MPYSKISELPDYVQKKSETKQRQWMHVWNSSYASCMKDEFAKAKDCESEAFAKANGVTKGAEMPDPAKRMDEGWEILLEKADPRVNYKATTEPTAEKRCGNCRFFNAFELGCNLVEGSISSSGISDLWTEQINAGQWMYTEGRFQVFIETPASFAESVKSQWIPFLPVPGKFKHPVYGDISITAELNQQLVDSVKNHVYQEHIPLDVEHQTKLSGAAAWIQDMRLNDDGSADAFVEWTERGKLLVEGGGFKYVSPEWYDIWPDPGSGVVHRNVVAGGAITTKPFFKERVLRALVASESGNQVIKSDKEDTVPDPIKDPVKEPVKGGDPEPTPTPTPPTPTPPTPPVTFTEAEMQAKIDEAVAKAKTEASTEGKTFSDQLAAEKTAREAAEKRLAKIETDDRHRRFTDLVAGRGGSTDGGPWAGNQEKHVAHLEALTDKFGEENEIVTGYIEQQNAIAAQVKESLFQEFGSGAQPASGSDPERKLDDLAKKAQKEDPKKTFSQAYNEVLATDEGQRLYQELNAPKRGS